MTFDAQLTDYLKTVRKLIKKHGWAVQMVGGSSDEPPIPYSVGLTAMQRPGARPMSRLQIGQSVIESSRTTL
jgi:hypothetical protein